MRRAATLPPPTLAFSLLILAASAVAFRLWTSLCFFPLPEWNAVRLAPTFMLRFGAAPYPGVADGALTTWIYGPLPLLLNLPATLATNSATAAMVAGLVTLLLAIIPASVAVSAWARAQDVRGPWLLIAFLGCLALWPNTSLHYLQADNAAVGFGLLANAMLFSPGPASFRALLTAALFSSLAVWSKQTAAPLLLAQCVWLGVARDWRLAIRYAGLSAAGIALFAAIFISWFGLDRLWLNLVAVPNHIPWSSDTVERARVLWKPLAVGVVIPAAATLIFRAAVWRRGSPWLLPALSWLSLLPLGLFSSFKAGGAANSLNGYLYLIPPLAVFAAALLKRRMTWLPHAASGVVILAIALLQLAASPLLPIRPMRVHLDQAEQLARSYRQRVYFPWHPLVTWFTDRQFYHAEDGIFTRRVAGMVIDDGKLRAFLPKQWSMTAVQGWRENGEYRRLQPASEQLGAFGKWSVFFWSDADVAKAGL